MTRSFFNDDFLRMMREATGMAKIAQGAHGQFVESPTAQWQRDQSAAFDQLRSVFTMPKISLPDSYKVGAHLPDAYKIGVPIPDIMKIAPVLDFKYPSLDFRLPDIANWPPNDFKTPWLDRVLADLAKRLPPNWPDELPHLEFVRDIIQNEGIPLVYVPRADIFTELVAADDRQSRVDILVNRTAEILEDCLEALKPSVHKQVDPQRELISDAVASLRDGHTRPTQALAINVCDTLISAHINSSHSKAKNQCHLGDRDDISANNMKYAFGVAPVVNLMTDWNVKSGKPRPHALSRHVTIHQAHPDHYTPGNAIIAVMVATGLMLSLDEMYTAADD
ncbi:hypothetical protein EEB12_29655 [Rhodococcus sp. WS1]|uniref:hypothetical protein n=1 Tax=unclassified Rhodococcus (in: high G+C Gram-positive bacteria) TaxID=192944 RepID=UPI0011450499|nr:MULTISPECIES: hypothetical protein [unclassified Rhodococcus (in: high G+C Gram-positive bacteria)]ROZ52978.1 hypothetical protein EEB12_29655 [Rhodococcus sp. WS1]TQC36070.1 hypothetical protein EEB16_21225 [Rhodococcus sp. WS7]